MPTQAEKDAALASALNAAVTVLQQPVDDAPPPPPPVVDLSGLDAALTHLDAATDAILAVKNGAPVPPPPPPPAGTFNINGFTLPAIGSADSPLPNPGRVSVAYDANRGSAMFQAAEWSGGGNHFAHFKFNNAIAHDGLVDLVLSSNAEAQLQMFNPFGEVQHARHEMDIQVFKLRDGVVAAPLWTLRYQPNTTNHGDEIDFEILKSGMLLSVRTRGTPVFSLLPAAFQRDLSGEFLSLALEYKCKGEPDDYIEWKVNGAVIERLNQGDPRLNGKSLPAGAQRMICDIWASSPGNWPGNFTPPPAGEEPILRVHGYRGTRLS
jgi:hypothetical protein